MEGVPWRGPMEGVDGGGPMEGVRWRGPMEGSDGGVRWTSAGV